MNFGRNDDFPKILAKNVSFFIKLQGDVHEKSMSLSLLNLTNFPTTKKVAENKHFQKIFKKLQEKTSEKKELDDLKFCKWPKERVKERWREKRTLTTRREQKELIEERANEKKRGAEKKKNDQ